LDTTAELTDKGQGTCVGKVIPGISIRIQPLEEGAFIRPFGDDREVGEIQVSGPVVTEEYDLLPEATKNAKIFEAGQLWHRMGDLGYFDQEGRLWFCGRVVERVVLADGTTLLTDCCEAIFNKHARILRTALIGIGEKGAQIPAIVAQPEYGLYPQDGMEKNFLLGELRDLAIANPLTQKIEHFFLHKSFPVDVRHNAKIHRLTLARMFEGKIGK
jgi:acyl-CoA synthetase (AMP-forming)/AMP-acid ligase II